MRRASFAVVCFLLASACGQSSGDPDTSASAAEAVPTEQLATLAFEVMKEQDCRRTHVDAGSSHEATEQYRQEGRALADWLTKTIYEHPETYVLVSSEQRGANTIHDTFHYVDGDTQQELITHRTAGTMPRAMGQSAAENRDYVSTWVNFCAWVPSHVDLLSTNGSPAANWVGAQIRLAWKTTEFANLIQTSGPVPADFGTGPEEPIKGAEFTRGGPGQG